MPSGLKDATALSSYVWGEKMGDEPDITWEITDSAPTYCMRRPKGMPALPDGEASDPQA